MRTTTPLSLKTSLSAIFAVLCVFVMTANICGQTPLSETNSNNILGDNYRLGVGDVIDVIVSKNESLSKLGVRVTNQGGVQLPMLDEDVPAACLTERELADQIKEKYKKFLLEPHVNVTIREFNSSPVAMIGAINSPGRFQLQRPVRLLELLAFVNGPKENAGTTIEIIRNQRLPYCEQSKFIIPADGDDQLISIYLDETLKGNSAANPFVKAGDIIRIDEADQRFAYIIGSVKNAQPLSLKEPVTLTQAIAMVGGLTSDAQIEKIKIQRRTVGSMTPTDLTINLKEIKQRQKADILLEPNDIVEIPGPSGGKKIFRDIIKTIIPTFTQLPMRVIP
jgi:polysaccharide biosynthesis/export protein